MRKTTTMQAKYSVARTAREITALGAPITRQGLAKAIKDGRVAFGANASQALNELARNSKPMCGGGDRRSTGASVGVDMGTTAYRAFIDQAKGTPNW
jgi:hypothetical protein